MTGAVYEPKRGDQVYDTRAGRRGVVTSLHPAESLLGPAVALEPAEGQLGGHWFSEPKFLRLLESAEIPLPGGGS